MKRNREGEVDRAGKKGRERLRGVSSDSKYGRSVDTEMEKQRPVQTSGGESHEEIGKQKSRERESETASARDGGEKCLRELFFLIYLFPFFLFSFQVLTLHPYLFLLVNCV